jgi:upstream activation factor subunit UAF30
MLQPGGISEVEIDGKKSLSIKGIGASICTFDTRSLVVAPPFCGPPPCRSGRALVEWALHESLAHMTERPSTTCMMAALCDGQSTARAPHVRPLSRRSPMAQPKQEKTQHPKSAKTPAPRSTRTGSADAPTPGRGGIAQPVIPSPALGAIVGTAPLSRAEVTKRVWAYIKAHALQDAQDRRRINADAPLKQILGRDQVSMFEMPRLLNQHLKAVPS